MRNDGVYTGDSMRGFYYLADTLFEDYFVRAAYRFTGADGFTNGTPVAFDFFHDKDNIIYQYQPVLQAYTDTQPAAVTFFSVDFRFHRIHIDLFL